MGKVLSGVFFGSQRHPCSESVSEESEDSEGDLA